MLRSSPAKVTLRALTLAGLSWVLVAAPEIPAAQAQGWWDEDTAGPSVRYAPGARRDFEIYPEGDRDDESEEVERDRRRFGRSYDGSYDRKPRWDDRWDDRMRDDDDDRDDDAEDRRAPRSTMRDNGMSGGVPPGTDEAAKPSAPTTGEFAPGGRVAIRPQAPPIVAFSSAYPAGSIVIDTSARKLYFVRGRMSAFAYPIGVGREGFAWYGAEKVSRIADWPDWYPPAEMRKRQPKLPERMLGGLNNPLGAKAIYLGNTLYRIHGTNDPSSIGRAQSSGCFRMMNRHVVHLASLVKVGTPVTVMPSLGGGVRIVTAPSRKDPRVTARYDRIPPHRQPPRVRWSEDPDPYPYDGDDNFGDGRYR